MDELLHAVEMSEEQRAQLLYRRSLSRKKRREREAEGQIRQLNITAMMDVMTIILVFLLKSYSASSLSMTASQDARPPLSSARLAPRDSVAVTVTPKHILVGDKPVVELEQGRLPASTLSGRLLLPLDRELKKEVEKLKYIADRNPAAPFTHELAVIGDRTIPYDLLLTVLYTAGQNELENYRFVIIRKDDEAL